MLRGNHRHMLPIQFKLDVHPGMQTRALPQVFWDHDLTLGTHTISHT